MKTKQVNKNKMTRKQVKKDKQVNNQPGENQEQKKLTGTETCAEER